MSAADLSALVEALTQTFPHAAFVTEVPDAGAAVGGVGAYFVVVRRDIEHGFRAEKHRLTFAGTAAGRTPDEALAGLELP